MSIERDWDAELQKMCEQEEVKSETLAIFTETLDILTGYDGEEREYRYKHESDYSSIEFIHQQRGDDGNIVVNLYGLAGEDANDKSAVLLCSLMLSKECVTNELEIESGEDEEEFDDESVYDFEIEYNEEIDGEALRDSILRAIEPLAEQPGLTEAERVFITTFTELTQLEIGDQIERLVSLKEDMYGWMDKFVTEGSQEVSRVFTYEDESDNWEIGIVESDNFKISDVDPNTYVINGNKIVIKYTDKSTFLTHVISTNECGEYFYHVTTLGIDESGDYSDADVQQPVMANEEHFARFNTIMMESFLENLYILTGKDLDNTAAQLAEEIEKADEFDTYFSQLVRMRDAVCEEFRQRLVKQANIKPCPDVDFGLIEYLVRDNNSISNKTYVRSPYVLLDGEKDIDELAAHQLREVFIIDVQASDLSKIVDDKLGLKNKGLFFRVAIMYTPKKKMTDKYGIELDVIEVPRVEHGIIPVTDMHSPYTPGN